MEEAMFFKILKNDLIRKKTMNIILFIFVVMASMFMAAGVNNLYQTLTALDYYSDKANMCDLVVFMNGTTDVDKMDKLLLENKNVKDYFKADYCFADKENLFIKGNEKFKADTTSFLTEMPDAYSKVFDDEGNEFTVKSGEIAIPKKIAGKFGIKVGDVMTYENKTYKKDYKVIAITKDYTYGSDFVGIARYIVSEEDYKELKENKAIVKYAIYYINSNNANVLQKNINNGTIQVMGIYTKSLFTTAYFMVMALAGVVMLVSVAIILIAFLALRFSILFTLENEYKQIGIMKAIGMKNFKIKLFYLTKYFAIAVMGATLGLVLSFPLGNMLLKVVKTSLLMQGGTRLFIVNILTAIVTVAIVVAFSFICTRKVKKYSAIEAIHNGSTGERYKSKQKVKLHNKKRMKSVTFMAINDILSNLKKYVVFILTFAVGLMIIITPMNLVGTLGDESMIANIGMLKRDFYYKPSNISKIMQAKSNQEVDRFIEEKEQSIHEEGVDLKLTLDMMYSVSLYKDNKENSTQRTIGIQNRYNNTKEYEFYLGEAPIHSNEIAITKITANKIGAKIGDTVTAKFPDHEEDYVVTGYYQSMNNMGEGIRFAQDEKIDISNIAGFLSIYGTILDDSTYEQVKEAILKIDPEGTLYNTSEMLNEEMGSSIDMISQLSRVIFPAAFIMIVFITLLMVKSFLVKEKREIALLKVLGFSNRKLKLWQMQRIIFASFIGVALGILFSRGFDRIGVVVFNMLGLSQFSLIVNPFMAYLIVPAIMVILNAVISVFAMGSLKHVNPMEVNNIE